MITTRAFHTLTCVLILIAVFASCRQTVSLPSLSRADSLAIVNDNIAHRAEADAFFRNDPESPFRRDSSVTYHGIQWFPIDVRYRATSLLYPYKTPEVVSVLGTKGEERQHLQYGYLEFVLPNEAGEAVKLTLNVYKVTPYDVKRYALYRDNLSVWFTDRTTGTETYGVGRYVEIGKEDPDPSHVYTIDFNKAYNPYCAYSDLFSCAVPRLEDHLNVPLRVGEKKYHE